MISTKSFAIVGGGIGGLTLAIALKKKGIHAIVYESAPAFKPLGAGIVLAGNAISAFQTLGMEGLIRSAGHEIRNFYIKDHHGNNLSAVASETSLLRKAFFRSVTLHRADLQTALVSQLPSDTIKLNKQCLRFEQTSDSVTIHFVDGSSELHDYVIAADGIHSIFRNTLVPDHPLRYAGYTCWRGIVSGADLSINFDEAVELWGAGKRFGIVPLSADRVYWYATIDAKFRDTDLDQVGIRELAEEYNDFPPVVRGLLHAAEKGTLIRNDIADIKPLKRFSFGNIVLLGDAAHSSTPNLGQGACMAIEDAVILANCIAMQNDVVNAFREFEQKRIKRTTKIVNTSYNLGKVGQWKHPLLVLLRNAMMKRMPKTISQRQLDFLHDISFN